MRIHGKTVLSGVVSVVACVAITTVAVLFLIRTELTRQAHVYQDQKIKMLSEMLRQKGEPRVVDGKLMFGDYVVNNNYEVVDKLAAIAGGTATIFLGDTRVSTNVMKDDGTRAVGTPLIGVAKEAVIDRVQSYRGEANILGVPYFTAYDPLRDANGKPFGVLYVGVKQDEFFQSFRRLVAVATGVAVVMALGFGVLIWYMAGRLLGRLQRLTKAADAVSIGEELETSLATPEDDEVGDLSRALDRLRESVASAIKRLDA
ncbi:MAG TPA: cache domain-containing protein [Polyangiaceae bacterium]|nr:cache domain-containing protein [Polyangiaceae bacterium]